jgi:hypothetical protein
MDGQAAQKCVSFIPEKSRESVSTVAEIGSAAKVRGDLGHAADDVADGFGVDQANEQLSRSSARRKVQILVSDRRMSRSGYGAGRGLYRPVRTRPSVARDLVPPGRAWMQRRAVAETGAAR